MAKFVATPEQIQEWKEKYGDVFEVSNEDKTCYLKKPSRATVGLALSASSKDPLKMVEVVLKNCYIAGDDLSADVGAMVGLAGQIDEVIGVKTAEVKKL